MSNNQGRKPEKITLSSVFKRLDPGDYKFILLVTLFFVIPVVISVLILVFKDPPDIAASKIYRPSASRKSSLNFGEAQKKNKEKVSKRSNLPSIRSYVTPSSPVMQEIAEFKKHMEKHSRNYVPPIPLGASTEQKEMLIAEHNYDLSIGNNFYELGNYEEAERAYAAALRTAEQSDNTFLKVMAMGSLIAVYEAQGNKEKTSEAYKKYAEYAAALPPGSQGRMIGKYMKASAAMLKELSANYNTYLPGLQKTLDKDLSSSPEKKQVMLESLKNAPSIFPVQFDDIFDDL